MQSRMLFGVLLLLATPVATGCVGIGPHYAYRFEDGHSHSDDVLAYSKTGRYLAVHAKGRPGWYVLKFEAPEGKFEQEFATGSGALEAWYLPPMRADKENNPDEIYAPDLEYFAENPASPIFADRAVRLDGTIKARGEGTMIEHVALELQSGEQPDADLKGHVRRDLHFVRIDLPKVPES